MQVAPRPGSSLLVPPFAMSAMEWPGTVEQPAVEAVKLVVPPEQRQEVKLVVPNDPRQEAQAVVEEEELRLVTAAEAVVEAGQEENPGLAQEPWQKRVPQVSCRSCHKM